MSALFDALRRREPPIEPPVRDPAHYDLLVLGGPVLAGAELEHPVSRAPDATLEIDAKRLASEAHRDALQRFAATVLARKQ